MDTPIMRQYLAIKEAHRDAILFFRMGDFYEMFFEDAEIASRILDIALTTRNRKSKEHVPFCGVPCHNAQVHIHRLIEAGYKVAICEQVDSGGGGRKILEREVVRVVTPGTYIETEGLSPRVNNFLACAVSDPHDPETFGIAFADLSTGEFKTTTGRVSHFAGEMLRIAPRELVRPASFTPLSEERIVELIGPCSFSTIPEPSLDACAALLIEQFRLRSLDETGLADKPAALLACGGLLGYLREHQRGAIPHLHRPHAYESHDYLYLDESTRRNLEIFSTREERKRKGSLLGVLDETVTAMGGRKLRQWLLYPLLDPERIEERLDAVAAFVENDLLCEEVREALKGVHDLERLSGRIALGNATPRDLLALADSAGRLPTLIGYLAELSPLPPLLAQAPLDPLSDLVDTIREAIAPEAPTTLKEGGIIAEGYNAELDELRSISRDGKGWIANLELEERKKTGISSLKVRFNRVFGYYIEVTRPNLHLVPERYERKQTLTNSERFITPELKSYEEKVLGAEDRINELEYALFCEVRERIGEAIDRIQQTADTLALLDVVTNLATIARLYDYTRPRIDTSDRLDITEGRHPVVERIDLGEGFVPNDTHLDLREQIVILTGPNMAGKSTYMRQVALIVLMAQIGAFVPARSARIGIIDRIFTRIGAGDHLARGESTFMVEMKETARILQNATRRSLILLDEIGRGTSTFDGVSIAWAVAEYLHDHAPLGAKTLFATHYHELAELEEVKPRIRNYNVTVKEWGDRIVFLRKIAPGATSHSYGIEVARLAGLPDIVIERAREILANLEKIEANIAKTSPSEIDRKQRRRIPRPRPVDPRQIPLFAPANDPIAETLRNVNLETLSPLEAFRILEELVKRAKGEAPS